jgi:predicted SprT family Zn-dependent metalloprotease
MTLEIKRIFDGGPLRYVSDIRQNNYWTAQGNGQYRGPYVCDDCRQTAVGVYRVAGEAKKNTAKWICRACYELIRSPGKRKKA